MFYHDPITELQLVHLRQAEDRRRAEIARWIREARAPRPAPTDRFLAAVGSALIAIGLHLRGSRSPAPAALPTSASIVTARRTPGMTAASLGHPLYVASRREVRK